jgi:DNA-binding MarR family transcriptional regulator
MAEDGMKQEADQITGSFFGGLLGYHLRRAWVRNMADFARAFGEDVRPVPFTVLCLIDEVPGITAAEIARQLQLQRANLAPMLTEIEGRGLIERRPDRADHRVHRLHLSPDGAAALNEWQARVIAQEEQTFGALTPEERETLRALLARLWNKD